MERGRGRARGIFVVLLASAAVRASFFDSQRWVGIHVANEIAAGSRGPFRYMFSYEPSGEWRHLPLDGALSEGEWYWVVLPLDGTPGPVLYFGLKTLSDDAVGFDRIVLDGIEVVAGLPFWLDSPCDTPGVGCAPMYIWSAAIPATTTTETTSTATTTTFSSTTTTGTTTSTATSTLTSTSTSSSTSTSLTGTSTTTSSSTSTSSSAPLVLQSSGVPQVVAMPEAFYDELEMDLKLDVNMEFLAGRDVKEFTPEVSKELMELVGLEAPSSVITNMHWTGNGTVEVVALFTVMPGSEVSALHVQRQCKGPSFIRDLNHRLARFGVSKMEDDDTLSVRLINCRHGQMFCCVQAVVHNILSNGGVLVAYSGSSVIFSFMLGMVLIILCQNHVPVFGRFRSNEERRGYFVMPMMVAGAISQVLVTVMSAYNKYKTLTNQCDRQEPAVASKMGLDCPPSVSPLVLEIVVIGGLASAFLMCISCWWYREWSEDCAIGDPPSEMKWRPVAPLESILRRSHLWCFLETRKEDRLSKFDLMLLSSADVLLTLAVVLTSFFMLQKYKFPGRLVAWHPWKMLCELIVGSFARKIFRQVALRLCRGKCRFWFVIIGIIAFGLVDIIVWNTIFRAVLGSVDDLSMHNFFRIIDISFSAGLVSYLLAQLCTSLILRFISVYWYEPQWRYRVLRCAYIVEESEIRALDVALSVSEGVWKIRGVRYPPQLRQPDRGIAKRIKAAIRSPTEVGSEVRALWRQGDISDSKPLVLHLQRNDSRWIALLFSVLDVLFGVETHLPVQPRWTRCDVSKRSSDTETDSLVDSTDNSS